MTDRRTSLCDAAIAVLAREGARGLTHHAVDDEAGVARGSTSYYYRTRLQLLQAVTARVVALDVADTERAFATDGDPVAQLAGLVVAWLTEPAFTRTRARLEVFLLASREPTLAAQVRAVRETFVTLGTKLSAELRSERVDPPRSSSPPSPTTPTSPGSPGSLASAASPAGPGPGAGALAAAVASAALFAVDGLVLTAVREGGPPPTAADVEDLLRRLAVGFR